MQMVAEGYPILIRVPCMGSDFLIDSLKTDS